MTQARLGSMLSVLAQRSFVELTRLFGASHLAEGQDPPSGSGSDITAEVPLIMSNTLRLRFELTVAKQGEIDSEIDLLVCFMKPPPKAVTIEELKMLSHGFLSIHLLNTMKSSISQYPYILSDFNLIEIVGNAIAVLLSLDSRNGVQPHLTGMDDRHCRGRPERTRDKR